MFIDLLLDYLKFVCKLTFANNKKPEFTTERKKLHLLWNSLSLDMKLEFIEKLMNIVDFM